MTRPRKYPWDLWADGREWVACPGVDFDVQLPSFIGALRGQAHHRGMWVEYVVETDGSVRFIFLPEKTDPLDIPDGAFYAGRYESNEFWNDVRGQRDFSNVERTVDLLDVYRDVLPDLRASIPQLREAHVDERWMERGDKRGLPLLWQEGERVAFGVEFVNAVLGREEGDWNTALYFACACCDLEGVRVEKRDTELVATVPEELCTRE